MAALEIWEDFTMTKITPSTSCFNDSDIGVHAADISFLYLMTQLRNLIATCSNKVPYHWEREHGLTLVAQIDAADLHVPSVATLKLQDNALEFLQRHTERHLRWRINNGVLMLLNPTITN
jgi:hypothetical protein